MGSEMSIRDSVMYSYAEISHMAQQGNLSTDLLNRLVRNTISDMRTSSNHSQTPREPTNDEIVEMAKALNNKFPCTRRVFHTKNKSFQPVVDEKMLTGEQRSEFHVCKAFSLIVFGTVNAKC